MNAEEEDRLVCKKKAAVTLYLNDWDDGCEQTINEDIRCNANHR